MKKRIILSAILSLMLCAGTFAVPMMAGKRAGQKSNQARMVKQARITLEQARQVALKRAPGHVEQEELEREHRKLVYSFDIRNARGTITEVQVDARNGRVVSVEEENAQQEAEEKRKEKYNRHP